MAGDEVVRENRGAMIPPVDEAGYRGCSPEKEYVPPRGEFLRNYEVNFQFLSVGCVVRIGCKSIPFQSVEEAVKEFGEYVKDPYAIKKKWDEIFNKNE